MPRERSIAGAVSGSYGQLECVELDSEKAQGEGGDMKAILFLCSSGLPFKRHLAK